MANDARVNNILIAAEKIFKENCGESFTLREDAVIVALVHAIIKDFEKRSHDELQDKHRDS